MWHACAQCSVDNSASAPDDCCCIQRLTYFLTIDFILSQSGILNKNAATSITVPLSRLFIGVADTCHALPGSRIKTVILVWVERQKPISDNWRISSALRWIAPDSGVTFSAVRSAVIELHATGSLEATGTTLTQLYHLHLVNSDVRNWTPFYCCFPVHVIHKQEPKQFVSQFVYSSLSSKWNLSSCVKVNTFSKSKVRLPPRYSYICGVHNIFTSWPLP